MLGTVVVGDDRVVERCVLLHEVLLGLFTVHMKNLHIESHTIERAYTSELRKGRTIELNLRVWLTRDARESAFC